MVRLLSVMPTDLWPASIRCDPPHRYSREELTWRGRVPYESHTFAAAGWSDVVAGNSTVTEVRSPATLETRRVAPMRALSACAIDKPRPAPPPGPTDAPRSSSSVTPLGKPSPSSHTVT